MCGFEIVITVEIFQHQSQSYHNHQKRTPLSEGHNFGRRVQAAGAVWGMQAALAAGIQAAAPSTNLPPLLCGSNPTSADAV